MQFLHVLQSIYYDVFQEINKLAETNQSMIILINSNLCIVVNKSFEETNTGEYKKNFYLLDNFNLFFTLNPELSEILLTVFKD